MLPQDFFRTRMTKNQATEASEMSGNPSLKEVGSSPDDPPAVRVPAEQFPPPVLPASKVRAQKAADIRAQNQHGRSSQEIDSLLRKDYREKGPTLLAQELGMKVTAVMMRARRMNLTADPHLAALRRVATRQQRQAAAKAN